MVRCRVSNSQSSAVTSTKYHEKPWRLLNAQVISLLAYGQIGWLPPLVAFVKNELICIFATQICHFTVFSDIYPSIYQSFHEPQQKFSSIPMYIVHQVIWSLDNQNVCTANLFCIFHALLTELIPLQRLISKSSINQTVCRRLSVHYLHEWNPEALSIPDCTAIL